MRNVLVTSVTSEATDHEIEFALDYNLNTFWKATTTANQDIILDFGVAVPIDGMAFFLRNYKAAFVLDIGLLWYSDNGTSWTIWPQAQLIFNTVNAFGVTLNAGDSTKTHRYWKISTRDATTIPEIAQILLFKKITVPQANILPELNERSYFSKVLVGAGGRMHKRQVNRNRIETFGRTWLLKGNADRDKLASMWDDSRGHSLPLVMQEDSSPARFVEIVAPQTFNDNQLSFELYRPTITFRTLPFIVDGEAF